MKNNNIKFLAILAIFTLLSSCDKSLDLAPTDTVSDASFWKTTSDFEKAANAFYTGLDTHNNGLRDQDSDITVGYTSNTLSNGSLTLGGEFGWGSYYRTIRATTKITENYEKAVDIQSETARYAGEARFFRARSYHRLVSKFGGVPLIKTVLDLDSPELDAPRAKRVDVVAYILEDLDWAIKNLPYQSELTSNEIGRVTKGAALAMKSKALLFAGTWAKYHGTGGESAYLTASIDASQTLINSGEHQIYMGGSTSTAYRKLFLEEGQGSKETILARRFQEPHYHNSTRWIISHHNSPTKQFADLYVCTDGLPINKSPLFNGYATMASEFQDRDPRMQQTIIAPGSGFIYNNSVLGPPTIGGSYGRTKSGYRTSKFISDNITAQQGRGYYDYMELRYAEVLLNHAEALFEKNGSIPDGQLNNSINKLRARVGLTFLTNALVTDNGLDMLEEIRRERTIELIYEGFRYDDLRRWKQAENMLPVHLRGVKFTGTEYSNSPPNQGKNIPVDADGFVIADNKDHRSWDQKLYLFPIPTSQIKLNSNLTQNPGW